MVCSHHINTNYFNLFWSNTSKTTIIINNILYVHNVMQLLPLISEHFHHLKRSLFPLVTFHPFLLLDVAITNLFSLPMALPILDISYNGHMWSLVTGVFHLA